ncbi:MAG: glycosyltransferase family 39 protein [Candidatus Poribacteria bacterium]|nr:glycosyltransferase family 39 protein [Candidatus Poribacteria bacterium]
MLLCIFVLGFVYRMFLIEHVGLRVELGDWFIESAEEISIFKYNMIKSTKSMGLPIILSILFRFCDPTLTNLSHFNIIIGTLSILLIFSLAYLLLDNENIALISSLFLALSPLHIVESVGPEYSIAAIFFTLLTLNLLVMFIDNERWIFLLMSILTLIITVVTRGEYIIVVILSFLALLFMSKKKYHWSIYPIICLFFLLLLPYLIWLMHIYLSGFWLDNPNLHYSGTIFSKIIQVTFSDLLQNIFIPFYRDDILSFNFILFETGVILGLNKHKRPVLFISAYYLLFFIAANTGHVSEGLGAAFKYYLNLVPAICLLAATGVYEGLRLFSKKMIRISVASLLIVFFFLQFFKGIGAARYDNDGGYAYHKHQEILALKAHVSEIDRTAYFILSGVSIIDSALGIKNSNIIDIQNMEQLKALSLKPEGLYYFYSGYFFKAIDKSEGWHRIESKHIQERLMQDYELKEIFRTNINAKEVFLYQLNYIEPN